MVPFCHNLRFEVSASRLKQGTLAPNSVVSVRTSPELKIALQGAEALKSLVDTNLSTVRDRIERNESSTYLSNFGRKHEVAAPINIVIIVRVGCAL